MAGFAAWLIMAPDTKHGGGLFKVGREGSFYRKSRVSPWPVVFWLAVVRDTAKTEIKRRKMPA